MPKAKAGSLTGYPSPEASDHKPNIGGDLVSKMGARSTHVDANPMRSPPASEQYRVSPATQRHRKYTPTVYLLDPLLSTPVKPNLRESESVIPRKKLAKSERIEAPDFVYRPLVEERGFRVGPGESLDIAGVERSRKFAIKEGTASFRMGKKAWRVSRGGEFYVPTGESAILSSVDSQPVYVTEMSS
jgi:hypothetical protein